MTVRCQVNCRGLVLLGALAVFMVGASVPMAGQAPSVADRSAAPTGSWTHPRTPWGDPDLQGIWQGLAGVPLERPKQFGEREFLTDAELAAKERGLDERRARQLAGTSQEFGFRLQPNYNAIFTYSEQRPKMSRRTSAIIDPRNGRLPPLTPAAVKRWEAKSELTRGRGESDSWEDRAMAERCLNVLSVGMVSSWGLGGRVANATVASAFQRPEIAVVGNAPPEGAAEGGGVGGYTQILQTPGYVTVIQPSEGGGGGHEKMRIILLDVRPAPGPKIRGHLGESRGHWEGNALVVEVTNLNDPYPFWSTYGQSAYPGTRETLRVIERYTLVDANTMEYRYTIDDPETYIRSYTVLRELVRNDDFKIAPDLCHEVNRDLVGVLANARTDELAALGYAEEAARDRDERLKEVKAEWAAEWAKLKQGR